MSYRQRKTGLLGILGACLIVAGLLVGRGHLWRGPGRGTHTGGAEAPETSNLGPARPKLEAVKLAVSPNSDAIAVIARRGAKSQEVWLLKLEDLHWSRLCTGEIFDYPSWSPRGTRICLTSTARSRVPVVELRIINVATGAVKTCAEAWFAACARWNPSRDLVGYVCRRARTERGPQLRIVQVGTRSWGSTQAIAVLAKWSFTWVWSADGKSILYSPRAEGGTWTLDLNTNRRWKLWGFMITDIMAASPDGSKLFCYVPNPVSENVIVSIPSGRWTRLFGPESVGDGAWSRDSNKLAVLERRRPREPLSLWVMDADGGGRKRIGQLDARGSTGRLGWISPRRLVVAYPDAIVILEEDGTVKSRIALPSMQAFIHNF